MTVDLIVFPVAVWLCIPQSELLQFVKPGMDLGGLPIRARVILSRRFRGRLYAIMGGSGKIGLLDLSLSKMFSYLSHNVPGRSLWLGWYVIGKVILLLGVLFL